MSAATLRVPPRVAPAAPGSQAKEDLTQLTQQTSNVQIPPRPQYIPPLSFSMVSHGIYRSGHPLECNLSFLNRLNLKSIIQLDPRTPTPSSLSPFLSQTSTPLLSIPIPTPPTAASLSAVVEHLKREDLKPCLLISRKGRHVVSVVVAAWRKWEGWEEEGWESEYRRVCGGGEREEGDLRIVRGWEVDGENGQEVVEEYVSEVENDGVDRLEVDGMAGLQREISVGSADLGDEGLPSKEKKESL